MLDGIARQEHLLVTGGSDYHGDTGCCTRMGRMPSGWKDPLGDLEKLLQKMQG